MTVIYRPEIEIARLNGLHDALTARGWQVSEHTAMDEGYPADPDASWIYPASYGGVEINHVDDISPGLLTCRFTYSSGHGEILVEPAGNFDGCVDHVPDTSIVEVGENELVVLGQWLDEFEQQARELNPRVLVECRFFGPCGKVERPVLTS